MLKFLTALIIFRTSKSAFGHGKISIIAYAHPDSKRDGFDAYFGSLIKELGGINRFLHTDGSLKLAKYLSNDSTTSLHAWGSVWYLIPLLFRRWKINKENIKEEYRWLAERSVCIENGGGAIASNAWQSHCQERWARATKPKIILWPWENHPWERELVRVAKTLSVKTLGYQHAVIGPQQFNPGPRSNPDGFDSIPEKIICSGPAYYSQLLDWGMPADMLVIGGSFRYPPFNLHGRLILFGASTFLVAFWSVYCPSAPPRAASATAGEHPHCVCHGSLVRSRETASTRRGQTVRQDQRRRAQS